MARLAYALAGQGLTLFISGEAGAGKTRLAEDFESLATNTQCICVRASCTPGSPSYSPFKEAFSRLSLKHQPLAALPAFKELCPSKEAQQTTTRHGESEERSLFAAQDVLRFASEQFPLVIRLDDLQLADARTIQMLHFLARGLTDRRVLLICTYSDDELFDRQERPHPLIETMRIMKREELCEEVPLLPLSEKEMAEALSGLLEVELEEAALSSLHRESGGNPQIAVELTLEALRSGALVIGKEKATMQSWRTLGIPLTLREWVGRKLAALPDEHLRLLECAATIGERFDAELLSSALGKQKLETLELLDAAVREYRLYVEAGEGYLFRWGVVRRVALERTSQERARALRAAVDRAKASREGPS